MLDFDRLSSISLASKPSPHACCPQSLRYVPPSDAFPETQFTCHSQRRILETTGRRYSDAWYQHNVETRPLLEFGATAPSLAEDLHEAWHDLASDILSPRYRECVSDIVKHDVRQLRMQTHFWRYLGGSFFVPHVDKPHKIVTHLLYLTPDWVPKMGGVFQLLESNNPHDVCVAIPPTLGQSVFLKRTGNAWHSVTEMPRDCAQPRRVVQTWFWEDPARA